MKSLLVLSRNLFQDLRRFHPDVKGLDRDLLTIEARVKNEGSGFLSIALPAFGKAFDQSLADGRMAYIPGFSRYGEIPKFLSGILCHIFDTKTGMLKEDAPVDCITTIRQVCLFFKKYLPKEDRKEILESLAEDDFKHTELSIRPVDTDRLDYFGRVSTLLLPKLDEFLETDCKHGPGAVLEGYTLNQKWSEMYNRLLDFDDRLMSVGYDLPASLRSDILFRPESNQNDLLGTCARLVFVPKSCSALRTITVEPCLNQFVQQGLNSILRSNILKCEILSNCLTLGSQVPNQVLALEGSRTGTWCTVDLSSASDLLSTEVVSKLFEKKPRFLAALMGSRTPRAALPRYGELVLKKYAGMGNATTFPIQSVAFAAIAMASIASLDTKLTIRGLIRASKCIRVFGDDIIIKSEYFSRFADWINSFGLKINQGKTFSVGNFRESCGVDAYKGVDVTPVYLRHDPKVTSTDASALLSLVSTSNQLWLKGYWNTSEAIRKMVECLVGKLPLVPNNSQALGWHTFKNVSTRQRWSSTLHRFEVRSYVSVASRRKDVLDGYPALMKFFHSPGLSEFDPLHLSSSVRRFNVKLRKRWVQA